MKYQTSSAYISKDICTSSFIILVYCLILDKNDNLKIVILEFTCSKIYKIAVKIKNWVIEINVIHVVPLSVYCHLLHWNNILKKKHTIKSQVVAIDVDVMWQHARPSYENIFFYKSVPCFHWQRILWNWRHSFLKFSVLKQYSPDEYKVTYFLISRRPPDKKTVYLQMMHARGKRIFNTDYKILKRTNLSIWSVKRKQPLTPF